MRSHQICSIRVHTSPLIQGPFHTCSDQSCFPAQLGCPNRPVQVANSSLQNYVHCIRYEMTLRQYSTRVTDFVCKS